MFEEIGFWWWHWNILYIFKINLKNIDIDLEKLEMYVLLYLLCRYTLFYVTYKNIYL